MKFVSLTICIFSLLKAYSQSKKFPEDLPSHILKLKINKPAEKLELPFSAIKILDFRQDTSKIGFTNKRTDRRSFKKLLLTQSFRNESESFYNGYYQKCFSNNNDQLLIVVKKFWFNPTLFQEKEQEEIEAGCTLYAQFEFFLKRNEEVLPIKRIDTTFTLQDKPDSDYISYKQSGYRFYEFALIKMLEKVDHQFYSKRMDVSRNKKTMEEVLDFYTAKMRYPILTDGSLKKGVYSSLNEFKNNKPSIEEFKVEMNKKLGKLLYNTSQETSSQIVKYWGYCDGKDIFLVNEDFPLQRVGNTFEFFSKFINKKRAFVPNLSFQNVDPFKSNNYITFTSAILLPYQLDMETGDAY